MGQFSESQQNEDKLLRARIDRVEYDLRRILDQMDRMTARPIASPDTMAFETMTTASLVPQSFAPAHPPSLAQSQSAGSRPIGFPAARAKYVRRRIRQRREREQYFSNELFADPAWDMMLDLYAAHYERHGDVSVSSLCIAAAVPATTALRWIKTMCDEKLFVRIADPNDGRRIFVRLSDEARCALDEFFDNLDD